MKVMRFLTLFVGLLLVGCASRVHIPENYQYKEIKTNYYKLASWQKLTAKNESIRIYIEGDGHAFNYAGQPTDDPTPEGTFLRNIAFKDPNPNVVYLARPCQFVKDSLCTQVDWTNGRFSKKIVDTTAQAIKSIVKDKQTIIIGYSGGALLSGIVINQNPDIKVQKWITIAGLLNHHQWTKKFRLQPLSNSLELNKLPAVSQIHYAGKKDKVIPVNLYTSIVPKEVLIIVQGATHDSGFDEVLKDIYR